MKLRKSFVSGLVERLSRRRAKAASMAGELRAALADRAFLTRYSAEFASQAFPTFAKGAEGAFVTSIDGERLLDLSMDFGAALFGHRHPAIEAGIQRRLGEGFALGAQVEELSEVVERAHRLTKVERLCFTATGTEAVMVALRLARRGTGRDKFALFKGSFHGHLDATQVASVGGFQFARAGAPQSAAQEAILLEYGSAEALEVLVKEAPNLAAVLVEPVQPDKPLHEPTDFLREVREICSKAGTVLIFDEMVTGFRLARGGCQELWGIRADLSTYGKVLGGGLPLGMVGGRADLIAGVDGGDWSLDGSSAPVGVSTLVAGTHAKHPLSLAAAAVALRLVEELSPEHYATLSQSGATLVDGVRKALSDAGLGWDGGHCGSIVTFREPQFGVAFELLMLERGVLLGYRGGFLSTAHTGKDVAMVVEAAADAARALQAGVDEK